MTTSTIPRLLDSIDINNYVERLRTDVPSYSTNNREYEIVYSLVDDKPGDLTRAIQEMEILKTRIKLRQGSRVTTLPSFWEVWNDPNKGLSREILAHPDPDEAKWLLSKKYGYKLATTFMPTYAKSIYEYFQVECVLDPCAGWGDRLIGATVSNCVKKYVGFDPNRALIPGYVDIMRSFGHSENPQVETKPHVSLNTQVETKTNVSLNTQVETKTNVSFTNGFEIYAEPFEVGSLAYPPNSFDFAFTSPPYFDYEDYTPSNPKYKNWIQEFYTPLFQQVERLLKPNSFFAIHIGDTSAGEISSFLFNQVSQISKLRYVSKIGLKGTQSHKIRDIYLFQKQI
jgi:hypothetical protein